MNCRFLANSPITNAGMGVESGELPVKDCKKRLTWEIFLSLVKRKQRVLVVAAGVIVQIVIWALAIWLLLASPPHSIWQQNSYLFMSAALVTVVLNLNPLNAFDGYYLLVAMTGINNLRRRSLEFYFDLFRRQESPEKISDQSILAIYAPLSIIYTILVLGYMLWLVGNWIREFLPMIKIPLNI